MLQGASDFAFQQWSMLAALAVFGALAVLTLRTGAGIGALWASLVVWMSVRAVLMRLRWTSGRWVNATT